VGDCLECGAGVLWWQSVLLSRKGSWPRETHCRAEHPVAHWTARYISADVENTNRKATHRPIIVTIAQFRKCGNRAGKNTASGACGSHDLREIPHGGQVPAASANCSENPTSVYPAIMARLAAARPRT
jgi:hypothetical protein